MHTKNLTYFLFIAAVLSVAPELAMAAAENSSGDFTASTTFGKLSTFVKDEFFSGKGIGFMAGLAVSLYGLYLWLIKQETTWGLTAVVGGVVVTALGGIYVDGLQSGTLSVLKAVGLDG